MEVDSRSGQTLGARRPTNKGGGSGGSTACKLCMLHSASCASCKLHARAAAVARCPVAPAGMAGPATLSHRHSLAHGFSLGFCSNKHASSLDPCIASHSPHVGAAGSSTQLRLAALYCGHATGPSFSTHAVRVSPTRGKVGELLLVR